MRAQRYDGGKKLETDARRYAVRELDPSEFRTFNKRVVREIVLPDSTRPYRIASRQDLNALELGDFIEVYENAAKTFAIAS